MTPPQMSAEIARIKSVLGHAKSLQVAHTYAGARSACGVDGPSLAEALVNTMIIHALGQPSPRACIASVVEMLNAGIDLFLFMRAEAAAKEPS